MSELDDMSSARQPGNGQAVRTMGYGSGGGTQMAATLQSRGPSPGAIADENEGAAIGNAIGKVVGNVAGAIR
jgi:hypothetical protein